jgi:DNA-binding CsgD family transcriptional regulator
MESLGRLLELVYGCVGKPERWNDVGEALCSSTGATATELTLFRAHSFEVSTLNLPFLSDSQVAEYVSDILPSNPRVALARTKGCLGASYADHMAFDVRELGRSDLLEWTRANGLEWCAGVNLPLSQGDSFAVMLHWAKGAHGIDCEGLELLRAIAPHLRKAIELSTEMMQLRAQATSLVPLHESAYLGIAHLDASGAVVSANDRVIELLGSIGIDVVRGHPMPSTDCRELQYFLSRAIRNTGNPDAHFAALTLNPPYPGRQLQLLSYPLEGANASRRSQCGVPVVALLAFAPTTGRTLDDHEHTARMLGLTPREAQVAAGLCGGHPPKSIAERLTISEETIRVFVRRIYDKLGLKRQAQLVRLLCEVSRARAPRCETDSTEHQMSVFPEQGGR